jgi:3-methylcrotonyl-CoA carboxylase alpha subunit
MEMNTRLQVEHPVTEMITGLDLVEWQLRVAAGERLPLRQDQLEICGHAIEARIYAEDPDHGFLPSIGRLVHLRAPTLSPEVRVDTGVRAGDEISQFYDPMLAKLIVWGEDRAAALRRLGRALGEYQVVGVATNVAFLRRVIAHDAFASARLDTGLIARHHAALFPAPAAPSAEVLAIAALGECVSLREAAAARASASGDPHSPWHAIDTWWLGTDDHAIALTYTANDATFPVRVRTADDRLAIGVGSREFAATVASVGRALAITLDGMRVNATVVPHGEERYVFFAGQMQRLRLADPLAHAGEETGHGGHLTAPMSGTIVAVLVKTGDPVVRGAQLLILEAMKMEHTITAPADGTVSAVHYREGDQVREGADLIDVAAATPAA